MKNSGKSLLSAIAGIIFCFCSTASAQQRDPTRGFQAGNSYSVKGFDAVNVSNGNVIINLPIASLPAGRGTSPGAVVTLQYNSKLWDSKQTNYSNHLLQGSGEQNPTQDDYFYTANRLQGSDRGGWKVLYYYNLIETNRGDLASPDPCNGGSIEEYNTRWKLEMEFPDGTIRQFIPVYGATKVKDGYYNINSNGLEIHYYKATNPATQICYVNGGEHQYTMGGMTYMTADGSRYRLFVPYYSAQYQGPGWTLYSPDGTVVESNPSDDPTVMQRITERNGGTINIKPTEIVDQLGRSIVINQTGVTVKGVGGENVTTQFVRSPRYVYRRYLAIEPDPSVPQGTELYDWTLIGFDALDQVILPSQAGGQSYSFEYKAATTRPQGPEEYNNYTDGWGELTSVTLPSGAKATYTYEDFPGTDNNASEIVGRRVTQRDINYTEVNDGSPTPKTETTHYYGDESYASVLNPDGTGTSEANISYTYGTSWDNGLSYRTSNSDGTKIERIWKQNLPHYSGSSYPYAYQVPSSANAYVKTEFTSIVDAAFQWALTAIKDFDYDKNGNVTKIVEYEWVSYGSVPRQTPDRPTGIPSNAVVKRIIVNRYYNQAPDADSTASSSYTYENSGSPKLKNVLKSTEVQNAAGTPVSRSEFYYDDPNNKGNLTETRTWDSTKQATLQAADGNGYRLTNGNYVSTSATYDQHGNPLTVTDAMGVQSTTTYGAVIGPNGAVYDLYPTQTVAASNHAAIKRTSTAQYDFYTGLPTSATDTDNNLTSATDYDALGRPLKVKTAVGTPLEVWTQTEYDDVNRRVISRSDVAVKGDGKRIGIQHFDQLGRVRLSRTIENAAVENPYNEADGIKVQTRYWTGNPHSYQSVSNPYRAATSVGATNEPSMGWTRSQTNYAGKHAETETFSGAGLPAPWGNNTSSTGKVQTDIDGDRTLVTDQAGKQRMSRTNALGQLTDVWEITAAEAGQTEAISFGNPVLSLHGLKTNYSYDTLSNLTTVLQGAQTRSFTYSSLSRLKSATNPELGMTSGSTHTPGTISYIYDDNGNLTGKTDPRNVITTYAYDALNRVLSRSYTNEPDGQTTTPNVTYTYDAPSIDFSKGKLTKVTTTGTGSNTFSAVTDYQAFDQMGRVKQSQQTIDGVTYGTSPQLYQYNLSGAMVEQTYPSGRVVKNVLDTEGDLALVQSKKNSNYGYWNYAKSFTYTAAGAVSSMQLGNGRWESTVFNSRLQPTQIALGSVQNGTDKLKLNYTYNTPNQNDNNGNVLSQTITVPTETRSSTTYAGFTATQNYSYDALNRLKSAEETIPSQTGWKQTFKYDRYGNRNFDYGTNPSAPDTTTPNAQSTVPKVVNPEVLTTNNRFKQDQDNDSVPDYLYDAAGNTTRDVNNKKFTYDGENHQTKVETVNSSGTVTGTLGTYFYDGDGKRVKKVSATETTIFIYDAAGKLVAEYANQIASTTAQVSYLTSDHLGSPRINTDQNGQVISRHDYQPFGEELYAISGNTARTGYSTDEVRKQFTSYERDIETELDFAQARMFNYSHGRFSSPDDFFNDTDISDSQSWNLYSYVRNNPLRYIDPSGERIWIHYQETITRTDDDGNEITETRDRRVEYTFGGLRNEDGSAYSGDNEYVAAAAANINFLLQDEVLGGAIRDLVKTREVFNIMKDPNDPNNNDVDDNQKVGKGTTIYWSGKDAFYWNNMDEANPSAVAPAYANLAHELIGHAWMRFKGIERQGDVAIPDARFPPGRAFGTVRLWEIDAINIENRAMMIENPCIDPRCSSLRTKYGGRDVSPYLNFEGFLEGNSRNPKRPKLKRR